MTIIKTQVTHLSRLTPEKMYHAWTTPASIQQWFSPDDTFIKCENNLTLNGYFIFTINRNGQEIQHLGHYTALQEPHLIKFTWAVVDDLPASSLVTITIQATENGSKTTLTHQIDAAWESFIPNIQNSWKKMFSGIEQITL